MSLYNCTNCGKRLYDGDDCDCGNEDAEARDDYENGKADWQIDCAYGKELE